MSRIDQKSFEKYLSEVRQLSESSISKYARQAHNKIQKELGISFYVLESMDELHQLLLDVKRMERLMEKDPKRMYSSAVSNYIKFRALETEQVYLIEDSKYNHLIEEEISHIKNYDERNIELTQPAELKDESRLIYRRDVKIAAQAIRSSGFLCEINYKHQYFISRATKRNYVEAHHIVPISTQALFENGLDSVANIACLCPVCHRQVHFGVERDRITLLEMLWETKHIAIKNSGIDLEFKDLITMY